LSFLNSLLLINGPVGGTIYRPFIYNVFSSIDSARVFVN
jgi:hypothetical protein